MPVKMKNISKQPRDNGEDLLLIAFFAWYEFALKPLGVTAWHVRNEHSVDARQGAIMKKRGVLAGVHDIHMVWDNNFATLELKSPNRKNPKMSDSQQGFAEVLRRCGHRTAMCQNGEQIVNTLKLWGLNPKYPWPAINKGAGAQVKQTAWAMELWGRHDD